MKAYMPLCTSEDVALKLLTSAAATHISSCAFAPLNKKFFSRNLI